MAQEQTFEMPYIGHTMRVFSETLPAYEAYLQVAENAGKYALAEKKRERNTGECFITLTQYLFECPDCYETFSLQDEKDLHSRQPDFFTWALQTEISELSNSGREFHFQTMPEDAVVRCRHCGLQSATVSGKTNVSVRLSTDNNATVISQSAEEETAWLVLPERLREGKSSSFPMSVELVFNHASGKTFFEITGADGECELTEITDNCAPLSGFTIERYIKANTPLKKRLIEIFVERHGGELPYSDDEITLETLILLNRFCGFPHEFYYSIPFAEGSLRLDRSFRDTAAQIKDYREIDAVYKSFGLPDKKQIRKTVFENPALLFYAPDITYLPFQNHDVILQILRAPGVYHFLSLFHNMPTLKRFISKLIEDRGEGGAWRAIGTQVGDLVEAAAAYMFLADGGEGGRVKGSLDDIARRLRTQTDISFNLPLIRRNEDRFPECQIDKYVFAKLKNVSEYQLAGNQLRNCLTSYWQCTAGFVVGIKKDGKFVGAVHVDNGTVYEAEGSHNEPLENDEGMHRAFLAWVGKNGLRYG